MTNIPARLGSEAEFLLEHVCRTVPKAVLHLPGPDFIDRVVAGSDRTPGTLRTLSAMASPGSVRPAASASQT